VRPHPPPPTPNPPLLRRGAVPLFSSGFFLRPGLGSSSETSSFFLTQMTFPGRVPLPYSMHYKHLSAESLDAVMFSFDAERGALFLPSEEIFLGERTHTVPSKKSRGRFSLLERSSFFPVGQIVEALSFFLQFRPPVAPFFSSTEETEGRVSSEQGPSFPLFKRS